MSDHGAPLDDGSAAERWETPVSGAGSLRLVALADDGVLRLTLEDAGSVPPRRWRFTFTDVAGYASVREEYRLGAWRSGASAADVGWTTRLPGSPWIESLRRAEPLVDVHHPRLTHYRIATEDDMIDVLSALPPRIEEIGAA